MYSTYMYVVDVYCVCVCGGVDECSFAITLYKINISVCVHQKRDYLYTGAYL